MDPFVPVLFALIVPLFAGPVDILRKNVSCAELKTSDGFEYKYDHPGGADINIYQNKTKIGFWENGNKPIHLTEVIRLDNNSVITEKCSDLQIQVLKYEAQLVKENWFYFLVAVSVNLTVNTMKPDPETPPSHDYNRKLIMSVGADGAVGAVGAFGAVGLIVVIVLFCCYMSWKLKMKRQQKAATCSEYFRYLRTRYPIKKQSPTTPAESSGTGETRGSEIQEASAATESQQNGISLVEYVSATDPRGSGENGVEQDSSHGSMHVVRLGCLYNNLNGTQWSTCLRQESTKKKKHVLCRKLQNYYCKSKNRESPFSCFSKIKQLGENMTSMAGVMMPLSTLTICLSIPCNLLKAVCLVSIHPQSNGLDHKLRNEEIQSTSNEDLNTPDVDRASPHGEINSVRNMRDDPGGNKECVGVDIPDSDMIAEAEPLVNKSGYGQDHVGRSFATPGTDVESKPRVKNFGNY
ncbi:uncharacterized protein [Paralichthys olivaceus]|uniref:uncharacterized protein isoform X4 n=1 Tax=Paralichthys olivaceus TaxID=8255 RepID=UPI0037514869